MNPRSTTLIRTPIKSPAVKTHAGQKRAPEVDRSSGISNTARAVAGGIVRSPRLKESRCRFRNTRAKPVGLRSSMMELSCLHMVHLHPAHERERLASAARTGVLEPESLHNG